MKPRSSRTLAAGAAATLLLLTGCSSAVDSAELEEEIKTQLEAEVGEPLESVDCPEDLEVAEGESFQCSLTDTEGNTLDVDGTWTDDDGNFSVEVAGG